MNQMIVKMIQVMILLAIGYGIQINRSYLKDSLKLISLRLVIVFGVGYTLKALLIDAVIPPTPVFNHAFFTFLVLPPPMIVPMFATSLLSKEQGELGSSALALHTLISIALYMAVVILRLQN